MSNYAEWWDGLDLTLKIYWSIAVPFSILFVLQLIFSFVGGDHHDAGHHDASFDSQMPFQFLTLKNMIAFFTVFGWTGILASQSGTDYITTMIISSIGGVSMMLLMATIMYLLSKANTDGTMKFENAIGEVGQVYLTVPANRGDVGKVQVKVQGVLRTLEAITDDEKDLSTGKIIVVMRVMGDNLLLVTEK
jgi:hypothetical protein